MEQIFDLPPNLSAYENGKYAGQNYQLIVKDGSVFVWLIGQTVPMKREILPSLPAASRVIYPFHAVRHNGQKPMRHPSSPKQRFTLMPWNELKILSESLSSIMDLRR